MSRQVSNCTGRDGDGVPDAIEPTIGWRAWDVVDAGGSLQLASLETHSPWVPGEPVRAVCLSRRNGAVGRCHRAPVVECTCGVHALADAWAAAGYFTRFARARVPIAHRVIGQVSLWGTVVEGSRGWRASHAYPARLSVPDVGSQALARISGFPWPRVPVSEVVEELRLYGVAVDRVRCSTRSGLATTLARADGVSSGDDGPVSRQGRVAHLLGPPAPTRESS